MLRRTSLYQLLSAFFGLSLEHRKALFDQIHQIVFNGQGGYDWETVYNMPIWLRRFTFETLKEHYEKQREAAEKQQNMLKNNNKGEISRPNVTPTYTTKAPKK